MKKILISILLLLLTAAIYTGCRESITDTQIEPLSKLGDDSFSVVLIGGEPVDNGDGTYTWTWSITKNTSKKSLSHWSFDPGTCLLRGDILSASYRYGDSGPYTEIIPIPLFQNDPSMDCDDQSESVFKFNYGTSGTTFYQLVIDKNYAVDPEAIMYFKAGNDCGESTFDGIGCPPPPCDKWIVYGSHYGYRDELFEVDLKSQTYSMLYNPGNIVDDYNYPNGNAYDPDNKRIYFGTNDGRLFYHQLESGTHVSAGTGLGNIASGTWYNGKYYYVKNHTNELYEFDGTDATLFGNVPNPVTGYVGYGDIVWDSNNPEWIIGSVGDGKFPISEVVWYIFNVNTKVSYHLTKVGGTGLETVGGICHKQLAFGSDGVLYALDTGNNANTGSVAGRFYTVDIDYTEKTYELTFYWDSGLQLNDLADGPLCK